MLADVVVRTAVLDDEDVQPQVVEARTRLGSTFPEPRDHSDISRRQATRHELWAAVVLTLAVVGVRLWFAHRVRFCGTPDSCFYLGLAQGMERTGSFRVNFLYDLLLPRLQLPSTGIEYWRPGTSFFLLPARWLGGVSLHSSAAIATLAGVAWGAAAWRVARRTPGMRQLALPCYGLALLLPPAWIGSLTPDSTLFYAAAVAWFLALFTVERQGLAQDLLALGCVAVAYLIRNDAVLLIVPLAVVLVLRWRAAEAAGSAGARRRSLLYAALMVGGFVLALAPMHLVYRAVLGRAFPGGTAQALLLNDLSDFNLYGVVPTAAGLLTHGVGHLLAQRVGTLLLIVYRVAAILVGYAALVFLPGLAKRRFAAAATTAAAPYSVALVSKEAPSLPELAGPGAFAAAALLVYSLLLPAIGVFSALRTLVGVLPWAAVLVVAGLYRTVGETWLAARVCTALLAVYAVGGMMENRRQIEAMNAVGDRDRKMARQLEREGARLENSVVMVGDPVQFAVTTGFAAVPVPGNGLDAARAEARALGVTHVMLDSNRLPITALEAARVLGATRGVTWEEEHVLLLELDRRTTTP